ncbi:MAG: hypothetical protein CL910_00985 [Deltaproteobacteria bacterium]|nr:hypothetical protein [Deltaproteobacteria bacterium]
MSDVSDDPVQKVQSGEAWNEFCDLLKKAGDVILREDLETSDFDRGEGLRYLTRLLRAGFLSFAEGTSPRHPDFRPMPNYVKMGLDNPDNWYLSASVSPRHRYRIRGKRGTIHYLSFAAQSQNFARRDRISGGAGHLNDAELQLDAEGRFEILASVEEPSDLAGARWLRMNEDTSQILLRQTFLDRGNEQPVDVTIECLGEDEPPAPLDPARVPGQLMGSAMYAMGCAQWFADWVMGFREKAEVNAFHLPDAENHRFVGGDPNIVIPLGTWRLARDEALVIEADLPSCHYWNFQLGNIWAESLDYRTRRVHLNNHDAVVREDGVAEIVVAHEDPGHPNWMDTAGHDHGIMGFRWVRADRHPIPVCRVVPLADLKGAS